MMKDTNTNDIITGKSIVSAREAIHNSNKSTIAIAATRPRDAFIKLQRFCIRFADKGYLYGGSGI